MFEYLFNNKHTELMIFFLIRNESYVIHINCQIFLIHQFNLRYPFVDDIKKLFNKAFLFFPEDIQRVYDLDKRKRPRRQGKL